MYTLVINRNAYNGNPKWEAQSRYPCQNVEELIAKVLEEHTRGTNYAIFEIKGDNSEVPITFGNETFDRVFQALHPEDNE